jgi:hypothetical protein
LKWTGRLVQTGRDCIREYESAILNGLVMSRGTK